MDTNHNTLEIKGLKTHFFTKRGVVPAVDGVDLTIPKGQIIGVVGESGCGKSMTAMSVMQLLQHPGRIVEGEILLDGENLVGKTKQEMCKIRGNDISMIFQEPMTSLNPVYTIKDQIYEVLKVHENLPKAQAEERVLELLRLVGIPHPELRLNSYPYQLSGGMQQRVMIAIALACQPEILLADEPTTALDVTVQAQIMELISRLKEEREMSIILISHNMGIIAEMCDQMLVMYGGVVVEEGSCKQIFAAPKHPYTIGLLGAIPSVAVDKEELDSIPGIVPKLTPPVVGCRFASRCAHANDRCRAQEPPIFPVEEGHGARCWLHETEEKEEGADE